MYTKASTLLVALIVLGGVAMRCHGLTDRTFWFDEAFSDRLIHTFSWSEMIDRTSRDVHPPFYYIVLRLWTSVFGGEIVTLRLFSVLMAGLTIVGVYQLTFEAYSFGRDALNARGARAAGLTAAALLASATVHVYWSQEARMYTLATALVSWCSWSLLHALRVNAVRWYVFYSLATAALMYTHNYGLFSVLAHSVFLLLYFLVQGWNALTTATFWRSASAMTVAACLYLPWLPVLLAQRQRVSASYWIAELKWWTLPSICQELVFPVNADVVPDHAASLIVMAAGIAVLVCLAWRPSAGRGLLFTLVVVPVCVSVAISLVSAPIVHSRYFQLAYVAFVSGLSGLLYRFESRTFGIVMTGVLVTSAVAYTNYFYEHELRVQNHPGIKGAVEYMRENMNNGEPIVVTHPCVYFSVRRYLRDEATPLLFLPTGHIPHYMGLPILTQEDTCAEDDLIGFGSPTIWVVETTGYSLNWETPPTPPNWHQNVGTIRDFPEISFFQGVVRVYRCHRVLPADTKAGT